MSTCPAPLAPGDRYRTEAGDVVEVLTIYGCTALVQEVDPAGRVYCTAVEPRCECGCLASDPDVEDGSHDWSRS